MSRSNQNNRSNAVKASTANKSNDRRPFCGVCQKAGKPESMFRGHYTKSKPGPDGVVICPTILSIECRFCHELGHSASEEHCPALREKKLRSEQWEREDKQKELQMKKQKEVEEMKKVVTKKTTLNNRFASAFEDSDDEEETPVKSAVAVIQSPVPIVVPKPLAESVRKFSYASMLKREAPIEEPIVKQYTNFVPLVAVSASQHYVAPTKSKIIEFEDEAEILPIKVEVKKVNFKASKPLTKIETLKEFYKPIPLEIDEEEDEFEFDVNFMSKKGYVCNDAW